jgi:4-diphosphocytidyl-2-C-methyl-D-erythritol kinase
MLLVNPGCPLSTKEVYEQGKWGLTKGRGDNKISMPPQDLEKMGTFLHNDLEGPALELLPTIGHIKACMIEAEAKGVLMTGSGPTVFGLFATEPEAQRAVRDLKMEEGWSSFVAHMFSDIEAEV